METSDLPEQPEHSDIRNTTNAFGDKNIHLVVKNEKLTTTKMIEILDVMLKKGVDLNIKNMNEETVFHLAIARRKKDVIDFLLTRNINFDDSIAEYMIRNENEKFEKLLDHNLHFSDNDMQKEEIESASFVDWILSKKLFNIDFLNCYGQTAFILALRFHLQHLLPVLLKYTNNISYIEPETRKTLLHIFLKNNGSLRKRYGPSNNIFYEVNRCRLYPNYTQRYASIIVKIMLDRGISLQHSDSAGNTPLHIAASKEENTVIIKMLIDYSANVNQKNFEGETPFYNFFYQWVESKESNSEYYINIMHILIAAGANVNETNNYKISPLYNAIERCRETSSLHLFVKKAKGKNTEKLETQIDLLVSNGCKLNVKGKNGNTVLHIAAINGDSIIVHKLIRHGADLDRKNDCGETPLCHIAIHNRKPRGSLQQIKNVYMLRFLLRDGANFSTRVNDGYSMLHMALWKDYNESKSEKNRIEPHLLPKLPTCMKLYPSDEVEVLLRHWIKLEVANLKCYTGFKYEDLMQEDKYKKIHEKCLAEIERLKSFFIDNRTSLYELLHMGLTTRRTYMNNEKLQEMILSPKFKEQFPEYSDIIFSSYREVLLRKKLINKAKVVWLEVTEIILPEICSELIFSYLRNSELFDFVDGWRNL